MHTRSEIAPRRPLCVCPPPPLTCCLIRPPQTGTIGEVKAAALDVSGPNTCVALFVGGGASIETPDTAGASKLLEYMAFSATNARCGGVLDLTHTHSQTNSSRRISSRISSSITVGCKVGFHTGLASADGACSVWLIVSRSLWMGRFTQAATTFKASRSCSALKPQAASTNHSHPLSQPLCDHCAPLT